MAGFSDSSAFTGRFRRAAKGVRRERRRFPNIYSVAFAGGYFFTPNWPYLGAGIAPTFSLAVRDGYYTGPSYQPAFGFIVQGGFDFMLNQHWGVFFDAKQGFAQPTVNSTGSIWVSPWGLFPLVSSIKTNARPVLFSTGLTYRF